MAANLNANEPAEQAIQDVVRAATEYGAALASPICDSVGILRLKKKSVDAAYRLRDAIKSEHNVVIREIQSALRDIEDPYSIPQIHDMEDKIQQIINRELGLCQSCGQPLPENGVPCNG